MSAVNDLWRLTATELVAGYGAGRFLPSQALAACLARCQQVNPTLNALIAIDADGAGRAAALSDARWRAGKPLGPLDGVPVTIKDNLHVLGLPTRWGSRALAGVPADHDELPVARLRAAGALIFGKTNVPEFTMQGYTDNLVFGPSRNPWNPALTPGGSSGGAVALVAAGGCPLALGTDGGGSIRRPASHTHTVGYKPSRGRVPRADGLPAIFLDYEVAGPMARSVGDVIAAMTVLSPPDASDASSAPFRGRPLSVGSTYHLGAELFRAQTGIEWTHVPYKGAAPAAQDLLAGHVQVMFDAYSSAVPNMKAGRVKALGIASLKRHPDLPDLPTIAESGVPGYETAIWLALFLPRDTPPAVAERLRDALLTVMANPGVRERFSGLGMTPVTSTPQQLGDLLKSELVKWGRVVKDAGIRPE